MRGTNLTTPEGDLCGFDLQSRVNKITLDPSFSWKRRDSFRLSNLNLLCIINKNPGHSLMPIPGHFRSSKVHGLIRGCPCPDGEHCRGFLATSASCPCQAAPTSTHPEESAGCCGARPSVERALIILSAPYSASLHTELWLHCRNDYGSRHHLTYPPTHTCTCLLLPCMPVVH